MIIIVRISFVFVDMASVSMANRPKTFRFVRKADSSENRAGRRFDWCGKRAGKTLRFIKIAGRLTLKFRNGYDNLGRVPSQRDPVFPVRLPNRKRVDSLAAPLWWRSTNMNPKRRYASQLETTALILPDDFLHPRRNFARADCPLQGTYREILRQKSYRLRPCRKRHPVVLSANRPAVLQSHPRSGCQ